MAKVKAKYNIYSDSKMYEKGKEYDEKEMEHLGADAYEVVGKSRKTSAKADDKPKAKNSSKKGK